MSEVVVTGIRPYRERSRNAFGEGAVTLDHRAGRGRRSTAPARLAVSYGIGGHNAVTLLGAAEAA